MSGDWRIGRESTVLNRAHRRIAIGLVDGKPQDARGTDVDEQGYGLITEQRRSRLIRQPLPIVYRTF